MPILPWNRTKFKRLVEKSKGKVVVVVHPFFPEGSDTGEYNLHFAHSCLTKGYQHFALSKMTESQTPAAFVLKALGFLGTRVPERRSVRL